MDPTNEEWTEVAVFCATHEVEHAFLISLEEVGLVEFVLLGEEKFIPNSQLQQLEKIVRLNRELEVNLPGVDVILHLLHRVEKMQQEISSLKNRLRYYEG